ncbi:phage Gp37/Gp68 family protein [Mesorhizobium sp. WSM4962]|uniref:DUF5131 family protein n=1 Tax=Mesorhizobium sp. WSM4962 TaxID=3038548 RepID=UPI00241772A1|nr:phage Gp37/Gp68 family protein [Mesorhizobium sp. WSM4962]MDG4903162.1 phage Gp37/Gp68 family protein [Mesorhizobium sp. WSM4962]
MADKSAIEWTDATWTPIRARVWEIQDDGSGKERIGWHCEHASEGCRFCYAEGFNRRLGTGRDFKPGELYREEKRGYNNGEVKLFLDDEMLTAPLRWKKPRMVFVCSMTDLFADFVPDEWVDRVFAVMALAPQHTFQVLTKRAARMRMYVSGFECDGARRLNVADAAGRMMEDGDNAHDYVANLDWPLKNVWLGVSAERQQEADERIPQLLATPAAIRFVSAEPLLGPLDISKYLRPLCDRCPPWEVPCRIGCQHCARLDWVIVGGESGPEARPMHPAWARSLREQCANNRVSFFFKQWGAYRPLTPAERNQACGATLIGKDPYDRDAHVLRVGKKAAGRLLDGIEHNGMPEARS